MKYLIDTNICIYIMNKRPIGMIRRFKQFDPVQIGISSITVSELQYGVQKSRHRKINQTRLDEFLVPFEILPYDDTAAGIYGEIRFQLEKSGQPIGALDTLIAAHALSRNLILITNNEKEFMRIEKLRVENWTA
ncbi:MAG: type II toxin-antitoxin system tRNA(fMet)-specific endonuclease VapC [Thermodesulfobacteriota bacterium]